MTITVRDISAYMDNWAPPGWAYPWDRVGLHTGSPTQNVERILVCLTVTPAVVASAKRAGASMIVAHHPLVWAPLKTLREDNPHTRLCLDICRANIACFAAHTNLDVAPDGVNAALAEKLQLEDKAILFPEPHLDQVKIVTFVPDTHQRAVCNALAEAGAGVIGEYTHCSFSAPGVGAFLPGASTTPFVGAKNIVNEEPELRVEMLVDKARLAGVVQALYDAHPYEEPAYDIVTLENKNERAGLGMTGALPHALPLRDFADYVRDALAAPYVKVHGSGRKKVRRVAVLGGSGGDFVTRLPEAIDAYVTGDISYHHGETARLRGIACLDAGHYATELPIVGIIAARLRKAFPTLGVTLCGEREPVYVATEDK